MSMVEPLHQISLESRLYMTVVETPLSNQYQTVVRSVEPGGPLAIAALMSCDDLQPEEDDE